MESRASANVARVNRGSGAKGGGGNFVEEDGAVVDLDDSNQCAWTIAFREMRTLVVEVTVYAITPPLQTP